MSNHSPISFSPLAVRVGTGRPDDLPRSNSCLPMWLCGTNCDKAHATRRSQFRHHLVEGRATSAAGPQDEGAALWHAGDNRGQALGQGCLPLQGGGHGREFQAESPGVAEGQLGYG